MTILHDPAPPHGTLREQTLDRLLARCPLLFRGWAEAEANPRPFSRALKCGIGWLPLVEVVCEMLEEGIASRVRAGLPVGWAPAPLQIRERFGELRFDLHNAEGWTDELVELAALQSTRVCFVCGAPVSSRRAGDRFVPARCRRHAVR